MKEILLRFVIGGLVVSGFALLGEVLRPKTFAGLFAAAPSIALATVGMTVAKNGAAYVSVEGRSMIAGAAGFAVYAAVVSALLVRRIGPALAITAGSSRFGSEWLSAFGPGGCGDRGQTGIGQGYEALSASAAVLLWRDLHGRCRVDCRQMGAGHRRFVYGVPCHFPCRGQHHRLA